LSGDTDPAIAPIRRWGDPRWNRNFLFSRQFIQATAFRIVAHFQLFIGHILVGVVIGCEMAINDFNEYRQTLKKR